MRARAWLWQRLFLADASCGFDAARLTEAILEYWWSLADEDKDGVLVAREAVSFLNLSGLPREALARVWCVPLRRPTQAGSAAFLL